MTTATRVPLDFTLTNQNFWGLGAAASIDQTATLASLTIPTISASRYGVAGTLSADAALTASIHGSSGSVSMDYPVDVNVATPTTVTPGSFLNIQTGLTDVGSVNVTTQSPYLTASLDFQASAAVAGSVGWGLLSHSFSANPSINKNLYTISSGDHAWNPSFAGISLNLSIPGSFNSQGTTLGSASNGLPSARAAGSAPFLSASADLVKLAEDLGAPIGPLSGSIDLGLGTSAHWDVLGADLTGTFSLVQQATFIPSAINVTLTPNFGAAQIKPLGQAFSFQVPSTWNQAVSISESYSLVARVAQNEG